MMTTDECIRYDMIVELNIATAQEINLVRNIVDGTWEEILDKIVFARTGWRTLEDYIANEVEEEE